MDNRRQVVAVVAAVAVATAGALVVTAVTGEDSGSGRPAASPSTAPTGLAGYRIVYRVEDTPAKGPPTTSTEVLEVQRPGGASFLNRAGAPPGGKVTGGLVSSDGLISLAESGGVLRGQRVQPEIAQPPTVDLRLRHALDVAVRLKLAVRGSASEVAGRTCTDYRTSSPLSNPSIAPPTGPVTTTSCVDEEGLVLRETLRNEGAVIRTRTAVSVGSPEGVSPLAGVPLSGESTFFVSEPVTDDSSGQVWAVAPSPPAGMREQVARIVLTKDFSTGNPESVSRRHLFTDGVEVVTVAERHSLTGQSFDPEGERVDLGDLGEGVLQPSGQGLTLIVSLPGGAVLLVTGSVAEEELLRYARSLRLRPTGTPSPANTAEPTATPSR